MPRRKKIKKPKFNWKNLQRGKRWHLGINQTWIRLFEENERRYINRVNNPSWPRPRTDREIWRFMDKEFAGRDSAIHRNVPKTRWRYNNGWMHSKYNRIPVIIQSHRYDPTGRRIAKKNIWSYRARIQVGSKRRKRVQLRWLVRKLQRLLNDRTLVWDKKRPKPILIVPAKEL